MVVARRLYMAKANITLTTVKAMQPGEALWDSSPRGFGARCLPSGRKVYVLKYRTRDLKQRWCTIGEHGSPWTPESARREAMRLLGQVAEGRDPSNERQELRNEVAGKSGRTLASIAEKYLALKAKDHRSLKETERILRVYVLPRLGRKPIEEITRREVVELLDDIQAGSYRHPNRDETLGGAVMADMVLARLRMLFAWHAARDERFRSPLVAGMARTRPKERARDRILSDDEIRALWAASEECEPMVFGPFARFLLLTAQRRDEVAGAKWSELDSDPWIIPRGRYKTKIEHAVPLSRYARELLGDVTRIGPYAFTTRGDRPISGFSKAKRRLDALMLGKLRELAPERGRDPNEIVMPNWTLHDLRRTARSLMSRANVRSDISERVLGHVQQGVQGTYDRYAYLDEKRHALEVLSHLIRTIVSASDFNIIPMHRVQATHAN
jgi:integrase